MELSIENANTDPSVMVNMTRNALTLSKEKLQGISQFQRILIQIFGKVRVGSIEANGWEDKLPLFLFNCSEHGLQYGYPSNFNRILICPECIKKALQDASMVKLRS